MFPSLELSGSLYNVCLIIAVVLSMFLADRMGIMRGFSIRLQKVLIIAIVAAVILGFIGAVLFQSVYAWIKTGVFKLSGMTFYGGLIFGVLSFVAVWFGLGKLWCKDGEAKTKFGAMLDIAACIIPLAHGIGRIGCLMAGCCHGGLTDAWYGVMHYNGVKVNGVVYASAKVVPIQLFEAIFLLCLSGILLFLFFKKFGKENKGRFPLMPIYCVCYGIWRFFIEYARADERGATIIPWLSPSQLIAIIMFSIGIIYFSVWFFSKNKKKE